MNAASQTQARPPRFMYILGVVILVGVAGYYAFVAANTMGLEEQQGTATVVGKEYRPAGTTYTTQVIDGRTHQVPHAVPEAYLLTLDIAGHTGQGIVEKALYDAVREGDAVQVRYTQYRFTGTTEIINVTR